MKKRLLTGKYRKPQNQISPKTKEKAIAQIKQWLADLSVSPYYSGLLAKDLIDKALSEQIAETSDNAPDVFLSDESKINQLVSRGKRIAERLDEADELETLLGKLAEEDAEQDGNSL